MRVHSIAMRKHSACLRTNSGFSSLIEGPKSAFFDGYLGRLLTGDAATVLPHLPRHCGTRNVQQSDRHFLTSIRRGFAHHVSIQGNTLLDWSRFVLV